MLIKSDSNLESKPSLSLNLGYSISFAVVIDIVDRSRPIIFSSMMLMSWASCSKTKTTMMLMSGMVDRLIIVVDGGEKSMNEDLIEDLFND